MRWPMSLVPKTYFPTHPQNRMQSEGNLQRARAEFLAGNHNNLRLLLQNRYDWMNGFIQTGDVVVEIGAGAGLSQEFIKEHIIATEVSPHPWIDVCVDGTNLPFSASSIDVVICANALHHFASPIKFLRDLDECLKPGGHVLLFEPNPSFLLLLALRLMRHEGWSFDVDVFSSTTPVNDPADPWSGNNAVSYLMFHDRNSFHKNLPGFEMVHDSFAECIMFPLSGGVTAKTKTIELPMSTLKIIGWIDRQLCRLSPKIFAMGRSIVLRRRGARHGERPPRRRAAR